MEASAFTSKLVSTSSTMAITGLKSLTNYHVQLMATNYLRDYDVFTDAVSVTTLEGRVVNRLLLNSTLWSGAKTTIFQTSSQDGLKLFHFGCFPWKITEIRQQFCNTSCKFLLISIPPPLWRRRPLEIIDQQNLFF